MSISLQLALILAAMISQAFFSGMETGVISLNRLRLHHLVRRGVSSARILEHFLQKPERLLGTTLIGTNISVVVTSTLSASVGVALLGPWGLTLSGIFISLLILTFCEYLPKVWFHSHPTKRCLRYATALQLAEWVLRPLSFLIIGLTHWLSTKGNRQILHPSSFVTRDHLERLAQDSEKEGELSNLERTMISRVFELERKSARDIMRPMTDVIEVSTEDTVARFYGLARQHDLRRMPVRDTTSGDLVGIINVFYLLSRDLDPERATVGEHMRPPLFIPDSMPLDEILPRLRRFRQPMGIVRDAAKQPLGIVTTEDVLQEIVGQIAHCRTETKDDPPTGAETL